MIKLIDHFNVFDDVQFQAKQQMFQNLIYIHVHLHAPLVYTIPNNSEHLKFVHV